jgi:hypothetical protein
MQPRSDFDFHLCLHEISGQPDVSLNAKTHRNCWQRGLGYEWDGLQLHSSDFPSPPTQSVSLISG